MKLSVSFPIALLMTAFALPCTALAQQPNPVPPHFERVYPAPAQAQQDLQKALQLAPEQHKRVLLEFGNNSTPDSQVLAKFFKNHINAGQASEHFLVVPVNVGNKLDQNQELAQRYNVPLADGVPVLVVLDSGGDVLTRDEDFRLAHNMSANDLTVFLNKWRQ